MKSTLPAVPFRSARPGAPWPLAAACVVSLAIAGCKTMPQADGSTSAGAAYGTSCLAGAAVGAALMAILDRNRNKPARERQSDLLKAAAGGCAIGLAATAIGRIMDDRQRAQHEAEMQKEARRRALEQQQYASTVQRLQTMPAATPQQRTVRDAELERARAAYQESLNRPVEANLGNGGVSTIQVQAPAPTAAGPQPSAAGCMEYAVLVRTNAGQARQYETWCPNASGQMVRAEVRETPVG